MGNSPSEISERVSSLSISELKSHYSSDNLLLSYTKEFYDPLVLQFNESLSKYQLFPKSQLISSTDLLELEVSTAFSPSAQKQSALKSQLITSISSEIPSAPIYDIFYRRLQAFCGTFEALLRQDMLRDKLVVQKLDLKVEQSSLPIAAQLGLAFGISSLVTMLKKNINGDPELYIELINQSSAVLSMFQPMSCATGDPAIESGLERVSNFFESILKGEVKGISLENQLASVSPLLGIALVSGNVIAAFSIILKLLIGIQEKGLAKVMSAIMPLVKALNRIVMTKAVSFIWENVGTAKVNAEKTLVTGVQNTSVSSEVFSEGIRYYEVVFEKLVGSVWVGLCDGKDNSRRVVYCTDGSVNCFGSTSSSVSFVTGEKIGVLVDLDMKTVSFYKAKAVIAGPFTLELDSCCLLAVFISNDSELRLVPPELPTTVPKGANTYVSNEILHPQFAPLQSKSLKDIDTSRLSSTLLGTFLLALIDKNNEKHRLLLETQKKSASIKPKELLSLDIRQQSIEYLQKILSFGCSGKLDSDLSTTLLISALHLIKSHLLASQLYPQIPISPDLKVSLYTTLQSILQGKFKIAVKVEAGKTLSECFEVFFSSPSDQIPFLRLMLKNYKTSFSLSAEESQLAHDMLKNISQPIALFDAFSLTLNPTGVEKLMLSLIKTAEKLSIRSLKIKTDLSAIIDLLSSTIKCLMAQFAKSLFPIDSQPIILNITKRLLIGCEAFIAAVQKESMDLLTCYPGTLIDVIPTTFLTCLILCKLSITTITEALQPALSLLTQLKQIQSPPPQVLDVTTFQTAVLESDHPYHDNLDISTPFKFPYAKRYLLSFDTNSLTEEGCDTLKLYSDDKKTTLLYTWSGSFPSTEIEVVSPSICLDFHSDSSRAFWGYKVNIKAEVQTKSFKYHWPGNLVTTLSMFVANCSKKLIRFEFEELNKGEEISGIVNSPFCRFGISDEVLGVFETNPEVPERLVQAANVKGVSQDELTNYSKKLLVKEPIEDTLVSYLSKFGSWKKQYSAVPVIEELVTGSDNIISCWRELKQASGIKGPASNIGGADLNQAERSIFALLISVFDITDSITSILQNPLEVGSSVKHIVKQSCSIRNWAQKRKQALIDSGKVVGYTEINKDIVDKCALLLRSEFRKGLSEAGVQLKLSALTEMTKSRYLKSASSRWRTVKGAVAVMQKLGNLFSVAKPKVIKQDVQEITKVWGFLLEVLENKLTAEEILKQLESRRVRGLSRALGFRYLDVLMIYGINSELLSEIDRSIRTEVGKIDVTQGLEAIDPVLINCVQSAFYSVYKVFVAAVAESSPETLLDLYLLLNLIESVNYPVLKSDLHYFYGLNVSGFIRKLLQWSKGDFASVKVSKIFTTEQCVTSVKLLAQPQEGSILIPNTDNLHISLIKGEKKLPITEFLIKNSLQPDYEDSVGQFLMNNETFYILIKRSEPSETLKYLSGLSESLTPQFECHSYFQTLEDADESLKISELKQKISAASFKCLKLFMLTLNNDSLQETIIHELFQELKEVNASYSLSLDETCKGTSWIGKIISPVNLQRNPMERFLKRFYKETDQGVPIRKIIETHVKAIDHGLKGVIGAEDEALLSDGAKKMVQKHPEFRNSRGEVDFFVYLSCIVAKKAELDSKSREYIENSLLFQTVPKDFYQAAEQCSLANVSNVIMNAIAQSTSTGFTALLSAFAESEQPGISTIGDFPNEFKNSEGHYDLYLAINKILSDRDKYADYYNDAVLLKEEFGTFPVSCLALNTEQGLLEDYQGTLMWLIYLCCSSTSMLRALSRKPRIRVLLIKALSDSQELSALAMLLLAKVLQSQHSFESLQPIWQEISSMSSLPKPALIDFLTYLFYMLGSSTGFYMQESSWKKTKRNSMDALEVLHQLSCVDRWKDKIFGFVKETILKLNKKLEGGANFTETEAGVVAFLAMNGQAYTGIDYSLLPLSRVRLERACAAEGILWTISDESCKIFSIESESFYSESRSKISGIIQPTSFIKSAPPEFFEILLKTWSLIQGFKPINSKSPAKILLCQKIVTKRLESLTLEALISLSDLKQNIQRPVGGSVSVWKKFIAIKDLMAEKMESKIRAEETKKLTSEEISKRLSALDEANQILVAELASQGYPNNFILAAMDAGCTTSDDIIDYIIGASGPKAIFSLAKWNDIHLDTIDLSETGVFYQSSKGHMVILSTSSQQDKKVYSRVIDDSIFHNTKWFNETITLLICVSGTPSQHKCEFGVRIGELDIKFESVVEATQVSVMGQYSTRLPTAVHYVLRVYASANGEVEICGDGVMISLNESSVFNGCRVGGLSLYLKEGARSELKGFAIYEGRIEKPVKFFEEDGESKESFGRLLKPRVTESGYTRNKLKIMGMPDALAKNYAEQYCDLEKCIQEATRLDSSTWQDPGCGFRSDFIYNLKLFDSSAAVEKGYEEAAVYENGELTKVLNSTRRVLGIKKTSEGSTKKLTGIALEEHTEFQLVGEMVQDATQESQILYGAYSDKGNYIKNIAMVVSRSPLKVSLPPGYQLLCNKEGCAINIGLKAEKSLYVFLAYTTHDYILGFPIRSLAALQQPEPTYGLQSSIEAKDESEDSEVYKPYSILELISALIDLEEQRIQHAGRDFMLSISAHKPEALVSSAESKGVAYLVGMFTHDFSPLIPFINTAIAANNKIVVEKILNECIFQIITACSHPEQELTGKVYESSHPYSNSMDVDEEICFPGAVKLVITFDSQCKTENPYDFLTFYKKTGREEEVKKFTGEGEAVWSVLEFPGDRIYFHFHSDGSQVFWGYKFTVKPVMPLIRRVQRKLNMPAILFIIDYISKLNFSVLIQKFFRRELVLPLFVLLHTTTKTETVEKVLVIFSRLITNNDTYHNCILKSITSQARSMLSVSSEKQNLILISIMSLLSNLHESRKHVIKEDWFTSFYNCCFDLKDFARPSGGLELFLFENFQHKLEKPIERIYESAHPYSREARSEQVSFPGASSLQITFDPNSAFDEGDEFYLSLDPQGKQAVSGISKNDLPLSWNTSNKGPDILITNNDKTVTRTNSSGWGMVVSKEPLLAPVKITISIDTADTSDYWYIGLLEASNTNLATYMGSDVGCKLWSWKRTGDFMKQGETATKGRSCGFNPGDMVEVFVNPSETSVSFSKNGEILHSFNDVSEKVVFAMSFGGSGQVASIVSCTEIGMSGSNVKKRKVEVNTDTIHMHFPINQGVFDVNKWENTNHTFVISTPLSLKRTGGEGPSVHLVENPMTMGRHYCEFEFLSLPEKTLAILFVAKESISHTQSVIGSCAGYKSVGNIVVGSNTTSCKGFKSGEAIGIFIDFSKSEVKFYKNKLLVAACKFEATSEPYHFGVMLTHADQELRILNGAAAPEDLDLLGIRQQLRYGNAVGWGYKIKVVPMFTDRTSECLEQVLKYASDSDKRKWKEYYEKYTGYLKGGAGEEFIPFIDEIAGNMGKSAVELENANINPSADALLCYRHLKLLSTRDIQELYRIIKTFNLRVKQHLALFDLRIKDEPTEFQKALLEARKFIFFSVKKTLFTEQLVKSNNDSRPEITINKARAATYRQQGKKDSLAQFSVFGQVLRSINQKNNTDFRNSERIFKVIYKGEGAIDAGGPYNEVISIICDELQSSYLPLLTPSQNSIHNTGEHRDSWVLNPAKLKSGIEMFTFLGKLIGVAIRTQNNLNLSLSPLVWKKIVVDAVDAKDLKSMDEICYQMVDILKNLESKGISRESFNEMYSDEYFTTRLSNGEVVELMKDGENVKVTFERSAELADLIVKSRLGEADLWTKAIRQGISAVVPIDMFNLFSWKQAEMMVCGAVDIKVEVLKANTDYTNGTNENDPHIAFFWQVMNDMNNNERQLFLKFVWGRSRLPASKTFTHMKIAKLVPKGPVDNYLPVSHTCFFTLDLPPYNSLEVMRTKLLYAIVNCTAIDIDTTPVGGWEENE